LDEDKEEMKYNNANGGQRTPKNRMTKKGP